MAIPRYNKYQFETSPRKIESDYNYQNEKYPTKKSAPKMKKKTVISSKNETVSKKDRIKMIISILAVFSAVFTISYRNSKIDESFSKNEELKKAYLAVEKENEQMKVEIENSLNYNNIEQQAKEQLGMQKLSNKQTVYVNLPKKDYIQPATEAVVIENDDSLINKLFNKIKALF